jgi:hypothetical protein
MNHIEKAYKAWRATLPLRRLRLPVNGPRTNLSPERRSEIARNAVNARWAKSRQSVGSGRYKRTAAHKEASRKAAVRRWAAVRRGG